MTVYAEAMRDAAFAIAIPPNWTGVIGGYYGGPRALHMWAVNEWQRFPHNKKLPIWVGGLAGDIEGHQAVASLNFLSETMFIKTGVWTALDMETRVDKTYVEAFGAQLHAAGFKVWVYGSASTVFKNPPLDGFWVADYTGIGAFMYSNPVLPNGGTLEVRATQYQTGQWDSSTIKDYTLNSDDWWV